MDKRLAPIVETMVGKEPTCLEWTNPEELMFVKISCKKCGQHTRMDIGTPVSGSIEEYLHLLTERLSHKPSFECFGGHFEFAPPLPQFWEIDWNTLQDQ